MVRSAQGDLVVRLGAGDLSLYDGDVNHSLRGHRHTDCDDPGGAHEILAPDVITEKLTFWSPFVSIRMNNDLLYQYFLCTWLLL